MIFNKADFIASYGISSQLPESDRPELSFSGRSNVGKSSLINKLCSRKNLARVSSTPGKTATINFYSVDDCYFVDLPGYGYAKVSNADRERWDDLINSYFEAPRHHTLLVQLLDCRHAPSADDLQMLRYLHYHRIPYVVALTKADKLKKSQLAKTQEDFENICRPYGCQKVVLTSGENGYGIYRSEDKGKSWIRINDEQHKFGNLNPKYITGDSNVYGRVYFCTDGRGIVMGDIVS